MMSMYARLRSRALFALLGCSLLFVGSLFAQSTGSIQGTVFDATGAPVPNAGISVRNQATGQQYTTNTDAAGVYAAPSLPVGTYRVEVKSQGMQPMAANDVLISVGTTLKQDFTLKVASTSETIEVQASAGVVEASSVSIGAVVNQRTVQEIPLNGRHFIDLALLIPGTMTPPVTGFLTAPLRGQGSFAFNSAGAREDSVNYMINGIARLEPAFEQIATKIRPEKARELSNVLAERIAKEQDPGTLRVLGQFLADLPATSANVNLGPVLAIPQAPCLASHTASQLLNPLCSEDSWTKLANSVVHAKERAEDLEPDFIQLAPDDDDAPAPTEEEAALDFHQVSDALKGAHRMAKTAPESDVMGWSGVALGITGAVVLLFSARFRVPVTSHSGSTRSRD